MDTITKNVYIDNQYPGVTLGVIVRPRGLIQVSTRYPSIAVSM